MKAQLDSRVPQKVGYCVPIWVRDEQVKINTATVRGRIQSDQKAKRTDPIAIVCYGPSLNQTWEKIRTFGSVMTCSGSHRFLLERGIVPTHHVEVDPRAHKVDLLGEPHPAVEYLISSTCHPSYLDHLQKHGANVKLWHVFANDKEAVRILPPGEWALLGGSSVGLRAMTLARFLGFTDQHVFGMDGCESKEYGKHAAAHPSQPKGFAYVEYPHGSGRHYRTTPSMLECARGTFHELNQMPDVVATFYGEGLVQAMAKDYTPEPAPPDRAIIAFSKPKLISDEYRALNRALHRDNLAFGVGGGRYAPIVVKVAESAGAKSILDYGCGKSYLSKAMAETWGPIWEYDPAVDGKEEPPRPADLVACLDVLEHIEPDRLMFVLDDLRRCVKKLGYFVIHMGPSSKTLADGRNAHLIQKDAGWWSRRLAKFFRVAKPVKKGPLLHYVVEALPGRAK